MFINTEIHSCFIDTLHAWLWERDKTWLNKVVPMWEGQFDDETPRVRSEEA